jgi:transglutaminase-like putative cysteine protease
LAFVTLLSFNQLFGAQEFSGPSLLGMIAATGVALWGRRLGLWPSTTIVASLLLLLFYLCLIFQAPQTFYGLPTASAIRGLGAAVSRSLEHSRVDFAPVPLRPGYAILTVAAMWLLVTLGEVATFRWRRPLIASMPSVALFAFIMIVGTQEAASINVVLFLAALFTYWSLESSHRLRSWGRWVPVWKGSKAEEPASITSGLARRMGISCVAAALALPVFMPVLEDGLVSWRSDSGGAGSGSGTSSGRIDPLVSLVPKLIRQTEDELFRVRSDEPAYWRLLTLSNFDGTKWTDGSDQKTSIPTSGSVPLDLAPPTPGRTISQQFRITGLGGSEVPLAGFPLSVQVEVPESAQGSLFVDPLTADIQMNADLQESFSYSVQGIVPDATFKGLKRTQVGGVPIDSQYLEVPRLSPDVQALAAEWTRGAKTDIEKLAAIQDRLRGFDYSLEVDQPTSTDYLEEFLLTTRVGYCQQFATAFALLSRHLGLPTRVAVGFLPGETDPARPDTYVVSGNETHAWPEVLFEGYGWVRFEPTPRQESSEPIYTLEETASAPATISGAEAPTSGQGPRGLDPDANAGRARQDGQPLDRRGPGARERILDSRWQESFSRIALVLALLALLFAALVPLLKKLRTERRYARATGTRGRAIAAFTEFQQESSELASGRATAESASAYAVRIAQEAQLPGPAVVRLASIYEAAEYAPEAVSKQQAEEAKRLARHLKAKLWAQASWWRRIKRLWSPSSLMPPGRGARPLPIGRPALQKVLSLGRS